MKILDAEVFTFLAHYLGLTLGGYSISALELVGEYFVSLNTNMNYVQIFSSLMFMELTLGFIIRITTDPNLGMMPWWGQLIIKDVLIYINPNISCREEF